MKAVSITPVNKHVVQAVIVSDTDPDELPTTGENVDGMNADQTFAPFSIIYCVGSAAHKVYIADENGEFVGQ